MQALKKQEQKINDLKKTLQRELKVQSLPNDEPMDPKLVTGTPPLTRKTHAKHEHNSRTRKHSAHERSPVLGEGLSDISESPVPTLGQQDFFVGENFLPGKSGPHGHSYGANGNAANSYHATISVSDNQHASHGSYSVHSAGGGVRTVRSEFETRHLEKDINFQYLKHVVMKFMLSREHEVGICNLNNQHSKFFIPITDVWGFALVV